MKVLTYTALFLGLIFTAQVSRAASLDSIWELDKQAQYYNGIAQELATGVSELEDLQGCQGTNFSSKFEKVFTQRDISFSKNSNIINGHKLYIMKCSSNVRERLMALIRAYQVEASAWAGMYQKALSLAAVSNKVAKRELTKLQNDQKEALEKLKIETKKAKPNFSIIKKIAFGALLFIGGIILGATILTAAFGFLALVFTGAFAGAGLGSTIITMLAIAGASSAMVYSGTEGLNTLAKDEMIYTNYQSDVQIRSNSLEQSQKFIDAIKEIESNEQESIKLQLH